MKKLLLSLSLAFIATTFVNAQTTQEWNISTFSVESFTEKKVINGLTVVGSADAIVSIDANKKSMDEYSFTQRLKLGGAGALEEGSLIPTNRYASFDVTGNTTITLYGMSSSSGAERTLVITDGKTEIGTFTNDGTAIGKAELSYTGTASTIYLYSKSGGFNLYLIKAVTEATSSIEQNNTDKVVASVSYFDLLGRQANETTKGALIKKVIYEDTSVETTKVYVQ